MVSDDAEQPIQRTRQRPRASYCYLLDADADLAQEFDIRMRMVVRQVATVVVFEIGVGDCDPAQWSAPGAASPGLLLLDGTIAVDVQVGDRTATELMGPGDLLQPWDPAADELLERSARLARAPARARRDPRRRLRRAHPPVAADPARPPAPGRQARERPRRPARDRLPAPAGGPPGAAALAPRRALGEGRAGRHPHLAAPHASPARPAHRSRAPVGVPRAGVGWPTRGSSPAARTNGTCTAPSRATSPAWWSATPTPRPTPAPAATRRPWPPGED